MSVFIYFILSFCVVIALIRFSFIFFFVLFTDDYTLSRQTISRTRAEYRESIAEKIKSNLDLDGPIVVHWDGKLLPDLTGNDCLKIYSLLLC